MIPYVLNVLTELGHKAFLRGDLNLNIVGVRSKTTKAGIFDDAMLVVFKRDGAWHTRQYQITTDPGVYYLAHPENWYGTAGVAGLVPDQYRGVYCIDLHGRTKYEALCQRGGAVKVYRDADKDAELDYDPSTIREGTGIGINIHASSMTPYEGSDVDRSDSKVGAWSAGCQVFARDVDFRDFMALVKESEALYGKWFTYTLITEAQLLRETA